MIKIFKDKPLTVKMIILRIAWLKFFIRLSNDFDSLTYFHLITAMKKVLFNFSMISLKLNGAKVIFEEDCSVIL